PNSNNANVTNQFFVSGYGYESSGGQTLGAMRFANNTNVQFSGTINLVGDTRVAANVTNAPANIFGANFDSISGKITGPGQLEVISGTQTNAAFLVFSNANNDWTGGLKITAGFIDRRIVLQLGNSNVLPDGAGVGNVTLNGTGDVVTLNMNGKSDTINGLISIGTASNEVITNSTTSASTLTVGNNNATATFAGIIAAVSGNPLSLVKTGSGTQTLSGVNTYFGNTTVSAGTLALSASGSIANSASIVVAGSAKLDVSGLSSTFNLGASQTLSNSTSTAVLNGNATIGSGKLSLTYASGTPSFVVTNGALTLSSSSTVRVNNTGSALTAGNYKLVSKATSGNTGSVAGTVPSTVTVTGGGIAAGTAASLQITSGELYLVVVSLAPPKFAGISVTGTNLTIIATNGSAGANVYLLQSTNIALPLSQWITNTILTLDGSGNVTTNLSGVATNKQTFYILKQ
ncbi:MAG TPA: autotransporter-associated beta strand repeat-containing protein, partial [Desulfuromonadaceae bacterium]|nr:autotransporter-associated beta strand repeat-containing protein [Desulfuromonadaceae bacterium]